MTIVNSGKKMNFCVVLLVTFKSEAFKWVRLTVIYGKNCKKNSQFYSCKMGILKTKRVNMSQHVNLYDKYLKWLPSGCLWAAFGLPLGCLWAAFGLNWGCLCAAFELPLG
jgi:hypothetical protein